MPREIPQKSYFRIGEVAELAGVKPYILRYWESEFVSLSPKRQGSGQRVFSRRDVELVLLIRTLLYERKYTIAGAREQLNELRGTGVSYSEFLESLESGDIGVAQLADDEAEGGSSVSEMKERVAEFERQIAERDATINRLNDELKAERLIAARAVVKNRKRQEKVREAIQLIRQITEGGDVSD